MGIEVVVVGGGGGPEEVFGKKGGFRSRGRILIKLQRKPHGRFSVTVRLKVGFHLKRTTPGAARMHHRAVRRPQGQMGKKTTGNRPACGATKIFEMVAMGKNISGKSCVYFLPQK